MIQIINYEGKMKAEYSPDLFKISSLKAPSSLDEHEINIIDLNDKNLWYNALDNTERVNCMQDFIHLGTMIKNRKKAEVIIILPQNLSYTYSLAKYVSGETKYAKSIELKNMLNNLKLIIENITGTDLYTLFYENTKTLLDSNSLFASFYFIIDPKVTQQNYKCLTKSAGSEKLTSIRLFRVYLTTLDVLIKPDITIEYLKICGLLQVKEDLPTWLKEYYILDDKSQYELVRKNNDLIAEANENIKVAKKKLEENERIKSILFVNGDELVSIVFDMLGKLFNYDLTSFIDQKKEDFVIEKENITFIGEIKGVTSNIKSEHIAQLERHFQSYNDELDERKQKKTVKAILIINHQRNTSLVDRQTVDKKQIDLAVKYASVIMETKTLIRLYEQFTVGEISTDQIIETLKNKVGLLQ